MWSGIACWASDIHITLYCKKERLSSVRLYKLHENLEIMFFYHVIKCVVVCHLLYWRNILWCTLTRLACSNCFRNSLDGDIFEYAVCFFLIKNFKNIKKISVYAWRWASISPPKAFWEENVKLRQAWLTSHVRCESALGKVHLRSYITSYFSHAHYQ